MNKLPQSKSTDIVVQEAGTELLIYNLTNNQAYNLNETSKIIYQACDGKTSFEELKDKHQFSDDFIYLALDELKKNNLIENNYQSKFTGVSRREVIKRVGLASMIALPIISSLVAPTAIMAQSDTCINPGGIPNGSPSNGTAPLTGSPLDSYFCYADAITRCCNNGISSIITADSAADPVTCTIVCGSDPLSF